MKLKVKIKTIGEERSGVSSRTGDGWRSRWLLLGWQEEREGGNVLTHYQRAVAFGPQLEMIERDFQPGEEVVVDLAFSSTDQRNGFYRNEARILGIHKLCDAEAGKGVAL